MLINWLPKGLRKAFTSIKLKIGNSSEYHAKEYMTPDTRDVCNREN